MPLVKVNNTAAKHFANGAGLKTGSTLLAIQSRGDLALKALLLHHVKQRLDETCRFLSSSLANMHVVVLVSRDYRMVRGDTFSPKRAKSSKLLKVI